MKSLIIGLAMCAGSLSVPMLGAAEPEPSCFVDIGFDAALKKAVAEKKLVLIDFYTTWCGPCKMLDRNTWADPKVQAVLKDLAIPLKIDAEKEVALAKRFSIEAYPTIVVLNSDGSLRDKYVGFAPPVSFLAEFCETLAGKSNLPRMAAEKAQQAKDQSEAMGRFKQAVALQLKGNYQEALAGYLWCYDVGMVKARSFSAVRRSYLLNAMKALSASYPPAKEVLLKRRDEALERVEQSPEDYSALGDYAALNNALNDNARTLAEFDAMPKGDPRRRVMGVDIYELLMKRKSYSDALEVEPDVAFNAMFKFNSDEAVGPRAKSNPVFAAQLWHLMATEVAGRITLLGGLGRKDDAVALASRLLAQNASPETKEVLLTALRGIGINTLPPVGVAKPAGHS